MKFAPKDAGGTDALRGPLAFVPESLTIPALVAIALAIRLYLSFTNYCIAGDGVAYVRMAQWFAAGDWRRSLAAVFSPFYPLLIAGAHPLVPDWELAGNLISALLGSAAVATIYLMMREAFESRRVAIGAAALVAIHPELASYSASVRTEAGYIFLVTAAVWLLQKTLRSGRTSDALVAGAVGGCAYLYRTEAIGLLVFGAAFIPLAALVGRTSGLARACRLSAAFALAFVAIGGPYVAYLRVATGRWSVSREFTAAMMYGMGNVAHNSDEWRRLGFSASVSALTPLFADPKLYLEKVGADFVTSFYNFVQALDPMLTVLLAIGLWARGRMLIANAAETFLALLTAFYFCGFAVSYTGTRFMVHLIPYTFGWVMVGLATVAEALKRLTAERGWHIPDSATALAVALVLLPRTLWPIGYDMRGVRYAGEDIAASTRQPGAVIARDGRIAWYAGAKFVTLPERPAADFCRWLALHEGAGFVVVGNRDETRLGVTHATSCLRFVKRYPRYGSAYFDLYAVRDSDSVAR
jgi:dolichyl-phosphate-mannose-protein mannosyltransferase